MSATARKLDYDDDESIILVREPSTRPRKRATQHRRPVPQSRPRLLPEREPRTQKRAGLGLFIAVCLGVLTLGLVGMLVINTMMASGAFTIKELQTQKTDLAEKEQALSQKVAIASAPQELEAKARGLGMIPQDSPAFLRLSDGAVLGNPVPQPVPSVVDPNGQYVNGVLIDPNTGEPAIDPATGLPIFEDNGIANPQDPSIDGTVGEGASPPADEAAPGNSTDPGNPATNDPAQPTPAPSSSFADGDVGGESTP